MCASELEDFRGQSGLCKIGTSAGIHLVWWVPWHSFSQYDLSLCYLASDNWISLFGLLTQGMLVALVNYLLQILTELIKLAMLVTSFKCQLYFSRVSKRFSRIWWRRFLEALPEETAREQEDQRRESFFHLSNGLQACATLEDISFDLDPQMLGIIGGTGSGKSTQFSYWAIVYTVSQEN